jgi:hypothetical protein
MPSRSAFRIDLAKTEIFVTDIPAGRTERMSDPRPARKDIQIRVFAPQPGRQVERRLIFLIFFPVTL